MIAIAGGILLAVIAIYSVMIGFRVLITIWWPWYEKRLMAKMSPQERASYLCRKMADIYGRKS